MGRTTPILSPGARPCRSAWWRGVPLLTHPPMADFRYAYRMRLVASIGAVLLTVVGTARAAPFRVCAFAFQSPFELAAIRSQLSPPDFEFIDLTPAHGVRGEDEAPAPAISPAGTEPAPARSADWLMNQCRPDLRCDVVMFSGEFAAGFFGNYGISLNLQDMEEASCQARCQGLFHDPREVFLFACNTLATKGPDDRTPREYLAVLIGHGFSRAAAERVVDLRYGPLGPSFRESMRRSFMGVPRIYGFASVAPHGDLTAPLLERYFRRKGDYAEYLRRAGRDSSPNNDLLAVFAGTNLVQTSGLTPLEPAAADRTLICRLYDDGETVLERLRIVQGLFARPDFLSFVPTIEVFFSRHPPAQLSGKERQVFAEIQSLQAPRRQMIDLMYNLTVSALKMQMAHLALQLGWISPDEFRRFAVEGAQQLLTEPLSSEVVDIACDLVKYVPAGAGLRSEQIPEQLLWHSEGFRMLDCLAPTDPRVSTRMLAGLRSIDESTRLWAAYALSRRLPLDESVLMELAGHLDDPSPGVRDRLQWIFTVQEPLSAKVLAAIREHDPALAHTLEARAEERQ
jgi:hypothetical protein